jgi:hypothetical protein
MNDGLTGAVSPFASYAAAAFRRTARSYVVSAFRRTVVTIAVLSVGAGWTTTLAQSASPKRPQAAAKPYTPPRTPWGDPQLEGVYSNDDETGVPFERPAQFEGRKIEDITPEELAALNKQRNEQFNAGVAGTEFAGGIRPPTHLIFDSFERRNSSPWLVVDPPDGKVPPLTEEARQRPRPPTGLGRGVSSNANSVGPFDSYEDLGLYDRCITRGIPSSMMPAGYGSYYELIQGKDSVALRYEMIHEHRVIPIDRGERRPHVGKGVHLDLGDARGWYDGNTLVVETTNFTARSAYRGASENLKMTERFTPVGPGLVEWKVTFDDPHTWTRPWTFAMTLKQKTQGERVYEYACHEGNYGLKNILTGARADDNRK